MNLETLRNAIWDQLLDAEKCSRYYAKLADRYRRHHRRPRYITLTASIAGTALSAASMLDIKLEWWGIDWSTAGVYMAVFLLMAAAMLWDFVYDSGHKSAVFDSISSRCAECETKLRQLWRQTDTDTPVDSDSLSRELMEIEMHMQHITERADDLNVGIDEELNKQTEKEAFTVLSERLATE